VSTPIEQKNNCLLLARHLEDNVSCQAFSSKITASNSKRGNALYYAAILEIGGLGLYWLTPDNALVIKDQGIIPDGSLLGMVFGDGFKHEWLFAKTKEEVIRNLRIQAESIRVVT